MDKLEIRFHELPHSKPIRRFIQKGLQKWIFQNNHGEPDVAKIEFFRDPIEQKVGCYIEVHRGRERWRNFVYGKGIQSSFQTCLKHLTLNTPVERSA